MCGICDMSMCAICRGMIGVACTLVTGVLPRQEDMQIRAQINSFKVI